MYFNNMWQVSTSAVDRRWLQSKHVFVGETRIATKNGYGEQNSGYETEHQYWYHGDHLGSAQVITDYEGELYERIEYTPYGETWIEHKYPGYTNTDIPYRFTGKELDAETGFYYYGARYLDPRTSRWLSGDPALGEYIPAAPVNDEAKKGNGNLPGQGGVFNLVNLHVYHYAGNNPVKYVDPKGRAGQLADFYKSEFQVNVDSAIMQIEGTGFGKSSEGKIIVAKLREMNNNGRIFTADLNKDNKNDKKVTTAVYDPKSDVLLLDENLSLSSYAPTLAHDGTHKKDRDEGKQYDFYSEVRGYANGKEVANELGIQYIMPTDEEIEQDYGLKKNESSYKPTAAEINKWNALRNEQ
jgi:RHS repeat-associated protein